MRPIDVILSLSVLCVSLAPADARAQSTAASVVVEVSNGTANGTTVVNDPVVLQVFQGQQLQNALEAMVGENGEAVFRDVPTGQHMVATARVKHQNMTFQGRPVALTSAGGGHSTTVQVFDVSSDASALSVGTHHLTIAAQGTSLEFTEYMQLRNSSDMAIRGSKRDAQNRPVVLEIVLPAGARDLTPSGFLESDALVTTQTGFYDTLAIPPGEHQVRFSYRVEIDRPTMETVKEISLPTSELIIFWEKGQGELTGLGDPDGRLINDQGTPVEYFQRHDLKAGDRIAFQISGFHVKTSDTSTWIVLAVAFAAVGAIAFWRLRRGSAPPASID